MSQQLFIRASHNYADEFDVEGCFVSSREMFDARLHIVKRAFEKGLLGEHSEFYFGTNEAIQFETYEDFADGFAVNPCTIEFAAEFDELTRGMGIGYNVLDKVYDRAYDKLRAAGELE